MAKQINTRIQHKHDIEANWLKATNFVPLQGELIIYDECYFDSDGNKVVVADSVRFKIGDGVTLVNDLPFTDESLIAKIEDLKTELSAQADWNQNDSSAASYIQNRTHWLDKSTNVILEETTVETADWGSAEISDSLLSQLSGDGRLYTITIDGISYDCNSWMTSYGEPRIGDSRLLDEADSDKEQYPEDVPFLIDYYAAFDWGGESWGPDAGSLGEPVEVSSFVTFATPGTHTIKIEEVLSSEYHPLDEMFIPDTIARIADVQPKNLIVKYQDGSITKATHDSNQIADAADAGIEVKFFDGLEYLNLLEYSKDQYFAVFYTDYYDSSNTLTIKYVMVDNSSGIMMADTNRHSVAFKTDLDKKQDKITGSNGQYVQFNSSGKLVGAALDLTEAKEYTDTKIADLVNSAPETLDTLGELAEAFADNQDVVQTLNDAIANKADKADVVPADWNQNDESALDYVKNRTHWVDGEAVHQLDEKFIPDTIARTEHIHNNYGVCSTGASTVAKTVEIEGFELREGAVVHIKFTNANSATNPTLNVSGTGAKPMYRYGTTALSTGTTTSGWIAGAVQTFIYDGSSWIRDYWNNNTYSNASLGQGYGICETAYETVAKTATLASYTLSTGGIVAIKFENDVCANATLDIASKGAKEIYYRGAAITDGVIKAGDIATFIYSTQYHLISVDGSSTGAITNEEIDEICGGSIQYAEDVMF